MPQRARIGVVGEREASSELRMAAEIVGRQIARRNAVLICGGMGGVMEAAAKGCSDAGGTVVGIIPTHRASDANPYVTIPIVTGMEEGRNIIVVRSSQAIIAIGGSYGTLSEIALALRLGVPVIGLHTWVMQRYGRKDPDAIIRAEDADDAVAKAWIALGQL